MNCVYAEITKSGRLRCTHSIEDIEGEGNTSPSFSNSSGLGSSSKMCPYQKYCAKTYEWIHINQNRCSHYKT